MPTVITTTDAFLDQISNQLAVQNDLLGKLVDKLAPVPAAQPVEDSPVTGEPEKPAAKKAPAKKATTRKRVTGQ